MEDTMKQTRTGFMLLGAAALLFFAASCGGNKDEVSQDGRTTITVRIMNEFRNFDKVLARYRELTKDDPVMSKIDLDFKWVTGGDYRDKLSMAVIAEEDYDLMFCGSWHGMASYIQQGSFADLSEYFNNGEYPGLKKAFPPDFVEAMKTYVRNDDGSFRTGIYGVNLAEYFEDTRGLIYREDLRKKYNCAPITGEESLMAFFDTVLPGETAIGEEWVGLNMYNFFRLDTPWYSGKHRNVFAQDSTNVLGDQTHIYIGLSEDQTKVLNAVFPGDSQEEFSKMPDGFRYDFITETAVKRADKWNKYLAASRGSGNVEALGALASYCVLSGYESAVRDGLLIDPDAEFGYYVLEESQRNYEKRTVINEMVTNNWLVVPYWSRKTDAVMRFLDWMFGSREHNDLFRYGIEGEDWEAVGDEGYKILEVDDKAKYVMPAYSLTLNPSYIRKSEFIRSQPELEKRFDYMYDFETYRLSPMAGFAFNPSGIQTEVANVSALSNELQLTISKYDAGEAVRRINNWHTEASKVGLEKIRAELIRQVQDFLDAKNAAPAARDEN
jgi:putative aldouronate transport system substrate-binding protein